VQRHKQRAQCSGERDPTAFIKPSLLQTEGAFDHDFNFISKLERKIEQNERVLDDRDIEGNRAKKQRRGVFFWNLTKEKRVFVYRAPEGMSRERDNRSMPQ
jgi:hypothetical protein